jgi:hypothetical protein
MASEGRRGEDRPSGKTRVLWRADPSVYPDHAWLKLEMSGYGNPSRLRGTHTDHDNILVTAEYRAHIMSVQSFDLDIHQI